MNSKNHKDLSLEVLREFSIMPPTKTERSAKRQLDSSLEHIFEYKNILNYNTPKKLGTEMCRSESKIDLDSPNTQVSKFIERLNSAMRLENCENEKSIRVSPSRKRRKLSECEMSDSKSYKSFCGSSNSINQSFTNNTENIENEFYMSNEIKILNNSGAAVTKTIPLLSRSLSDVNSVSDTSTTEIIKRATVIKKVSSPFFVRSMTMKISR